MKRHNEQTLGEVLQQMINRMGMQPKLDESKLNEVWEDLVGKLIARDTEQLYIVKNTVYVRFKSAALKQEVSYAKNKLLQHINEALGGNRIKEIILL